jgi:hypothetical protein
MPLVASFGAALMALTGLFGASVFEGNPADAVTPAPTAEYSGGQMMAADPNGGYWTVDAAGDVTPYGVAPNFGSPAQSHIALSQPIVGMATTPDGAGYWLVASDGGLFSYGDATFSGSTAGTGSNALGIVVNPPEYSYALVSRSGSATYFGRHHGGGSSNNGSSNSGSGTTTTTTAPAPTTTTTTPPSPTTTTTTPAPTTTTTTPAPTTTTTTPPTTTTTTTPSSSGLSLGSYNGAGNTSGAQSFASETHTTASIYSDYLDGSSWSSMVGSAGSPPWVIGDIKGKLGSSRLELSVPLVTAGFSSHQAALASYAGNPASWDANLTTLAKNLVSSGFSNSIIRLMWEPDSGIYSNEDLASAANYATLWRDAYTAMMSVSGAQFQWAWYWGGNFDATTNNTAYPGDAYVNYVTFDFYDQSWDGSCGIAYNGSNFTATQENCLWSRDFNSLLGKLTSFASSHSKRVGIGEFGVINRSDGHGGGDDPTFVNAFSTWLKANNVAWASYFNFNSGGNSILSNYSNSLAAYQADLG